MRRAASRRRTGPWNRDADLAAPIAGPGRIARGEIVIWRAAGAALGMAAANIFILLSHERSGSHFVGEFLASLANFKVFDEVCNPDAVKPDRYLESFYRFKYDTILKDPQFLLNPTQQGHRAFVEAYFNLLRSLRAPHHIAVDIKYGHVQNFEWWWWPMLERPTLLNICEANKIGVVHLFRENVIEATVSSMIAEKRNTWHSWEDQADATASQTFKLPIHDVVRKARILEREIYWFKEWTMKNLSFQMSYEQVSAELGRGGQLDTALTNFLGSKPVGPFKPRHRKLTRPLYEVLENFSELKAACEAVGLSSMVAGPP
jgi:hypothetical protein